MTIYFLRPVGMDGPIKIGFSVVPEDRFVHYSRFSPIPLEIVARCPGDVNVERGFHAMFWGQRSHHEWFRYSEDLGAVIASVNAGTFDFSTLPPRVMPILSAQTNRARGLKIALGHRRNALRRGVPDEVAAAAFELARQTAEQFAQSVAVIEKYLRDTQAERDAIPPKPRWVRPA